MTSENRADELLAAYLARAQTSAAIRVVDCDQKVASAKRGVCANELSADDFRLLAPGVSRFYNWRYESKDFPPAGTNMEFIPMAWGEGQTVRDGLQAYLARTAKKPRVVLAVNEPNPRGQAFITPEHTADFYRGQRQAKGGARRLQVPVRPSCLRPMPGPQRLVLEARRGGQGASPGCAEQFAEVTLWREALAHPRQCGDPAWHQFLAASTLVASPVIAPLFPGATFLHPRASPRRAASSAGFTKLIR